VAFRLGMIVFRSTVCSSSTNGPMLIEALIGQCLFARAEQEQAVPDDESDDEYQTKTPPAGGTGARAIDRGSRMDRPSRRGPQFLNPYQRSTQQEQGGNSFPSIYLELVFIRLVSGTGAKLRTLLEQVSATGCMVIETARVNAFMDGEGDQAGIANHPREIVCHRFGAHQNARLSNLAALAEIPG